MIQSQQLLELTDFFNDDQKEAIFCDTNCVVTAGAGSGKTSVLTYRFFRLVAQKKADVDQILTLTFTKAAAAQMYERIYKLFYRFKDDEDITLQLEKFKNATISTIDSFCYQVVQTDVTRFGLSPSFTLDNDKSSQIAQRCAYTLIQRYKEHTAIRFLSSVYSPEDLIENVFCFIALHHFYPEDSFDREQIVSYITSFLQESTQQLIKEVEQILQYFISFDDSSKIFKDNEANCKEILPVLRDLNRCIEQRQSLKTLMAKLKKMRSKTDFKEEYNETIDIFRIKTPMLLSFVEALTQIELIDPIYEIFEIYHELYLEQKRSQEVLTYNDVSHMAKVILMENDEVRRYFYQKYRYIMVDEFQDTNTLQKEIIYLLATEKNPREGEAISVNSLKKDKLFFVGDEKQSIYRFRGADVRVFKQLNEELLSSGGKQITLHTNYRSEKHLISLFNSLFKEVFSSNEYDFEANFTPLTAKERDENSCVPSSSSMVIIPHINSVESEGDGEEFESGAEIEALYIAKKIEEMVFSDEYLIEKGGELSRPSYDDIAILLRTTSPQMYYEKALRRCGIPYQLSSVKSLFLEAVMNDIYVMLQLIVYHDDLLSYAALLRSPFCNIDDDVVALAVKRAKEDKKLFTLEEFTSPFMKERYDALHALYDSLVLMSERESVAQLLSHLWFEGGYRLHLLSDLSYSVYLEHFDYLVEVALDIERKGGSLITFLDYLRDRMGNNEKVEDIEVFGEGSEGVNIMTIHKSKGLEFPIVIIANAGGKGRNISTPPLYYYESEQGDFPTVCHMNEDGKGKNLFFETDKSKIAASESAELKRLLYVAFTRAQYHLLVTGYDNKSNIGEQHKEKNFLSMIYYNARPMSEYENKEGSLYIEEGVDLSFDDNKENLSRSAIRKRALEFEPWYEQCEVNYRYQSRLKKVTAIQGEDYHHSQANVVEKLPSLLCDDILQHYQIHNHFGSWAHSMFEYVFVSLKGEYENISVEEYENRMPKELNSLSITEREKKTIISSLETIVDSFFNSTFYHSLCTENLIKMESEVPFASRMEIEGEVVVLNGVIDLLVYYPDHLVVVDFKTDALLDISAHTTQLSLYTKAVEKIFNKEVSSVLVYLREKECVRWL